MRCAIDFANKTTMSIGDRRPVYNDLACYKINDCGPFLVEESPRHFCMVMFSYDDCAANTFDRNIECLCIFVYHFGSARAVARQ